MTVSGLTTLHNAPRTCLRQGWELVTQRSLDDVVHVAHLVACWLLAVVICLGIDSGLQMSLEIMSHDAAATHVALGSRARTWPVNGSPAGFKKQLCTGTCVCVCVHTRKHTLRRVIKTDARSPQSLLLHGWGGGGAKPKEPLAAEPSKHQGNGV